MDNKLKNYLATIIIVPILLVLLTVALFIKEMMIIFLLSLIATHLIAEYIQKHIYK